MDGQSVWSHADFAWGFIAFRRPEYWREHGTGSYLSGFDKSLVPERIYHEKGTDRWWTRNELQHLGAPENLATSIRLNGKEQMRRMRSDAFAAIPGKPQIVAEVTAELEEKKCLLRDCNVRFQQKRPWQKFQSEACRLAHWKQRTPRTARRPLVHPSSALQARTMAPLIPPRRD